MQLGNRFSQHSFASIPDVKQARSTFDRSHTVKDTMDFDYLTPIFVEEVIPGDTHNLTLSTFMRLSTPLKPVMDNAYVDFFFFFVPNRLVWTNWERFNGAQDNPGDSTSYVVPSLTAGAAFSVGSIFDKFGLPTDVANVNVQNTLPLRAYIKIYNDWFRDQNMQNSVTLPTGDGPDVQASFALQKRGKRHDYFTSCLPWPQKGAAVSIPLGTSAPVKLVPYTTNPAQTKMQIASTGANPTNGSLSVTSQVLVGAGGENLVIDPNGRMYADLSTSTAATINQLRLAFMTQSLLELDARGGTRYVEILRSHFGVVSPDFRLQRAEFLGGGEIRINQTPVAQSTPTPAAGTTTPQGNLAAYGTAMAQPGQNIGFSKSFVEHGYIIGLACPRADLTYQQGLNKMWSRSTRFDFFWPKLQELGEQAVLNQEIYCNPAGGQDTAVFGYQERHGEYRYKPSEIRGQFRSTYATPLDMWHYAEKFASLPALNSSFIVQNTPILRTLAVQASPHLICDYWFKLRSARPMVAYSTPATLGRF